MQLKQLTLFILLLSFWACNTYNNKVPPSVQKASNASQPKKQVPSAEYLKRVLSDSVIHYSYFTQLLRRDDSAYYVFYVTEVNNKKIAVVAITDSTLLLFQNINKKWVRTDSLAFDNYARDFAVTDLNGDNEDDFIVYGAGDIHGMCKPFVFITKNGLLHYRPDIQLYNIEYDEKKGLIKSHYYGSMTSPNDKEYYKWIGDSLRLVCGVENNYNYSQNEKHALIAFYKLRNGKRYNYQVVRDDSGAVFDTALWRD